MSKSYDVCLEERIVALMKEQSERKYWPVGGGQTYSPLMVAMIVCVGLALHATLDASVRGTHGKKKGLGKTNGGPHRRRR